MSHSTHIGFNRPLMYPPRFTAALREFEPPVREPPEDLGVGQRATAVANPSPLFGPDPFRLLLPFTVGVGHNPESIPDMRGANVTSLYAMPFRVIPERGQVSEYVAKPSMAQICDVLHDDERWSKLANKAGVITP
jgi:hypothetical protein